MSGPTSFPTMPAPRRWAPKSPRQRIRALLRVDALANSRRKPRPITLACISLPPPVTDARTCSD
jgi:hypothetical protein